MYGKYVHIKAVTYLTFPNKQDFLPELMYQTEAQEELSNTYIFLMYDPITFVMYHLAN